MDNAWATRTAQAHFSDARRKALLSALLDIFTRRPNKMLSLEEVRARLNVRGQRYLGHQTVPIDHPFLVGIEQCPLCGWKNPGPKSERHARLVALILCLVSVALVAYLSRHSRIFSNSNAPNMPIGDHEV